MSLSAEELLAGGALTFEVEVPEGVLHPREPGGGGEGGDGPGPAPDAVPRKVRVRPLTVRDLQLIGRAAKESDALMAALMVQRALVEPELSIAEVSAMHVGLLRFLLGWVERVSGIDASPDDLAEAVEAPLAKAAFALARGYGWTPEQTNDLTVGQVLLHLRMLQEAAGA
jgi:hypothetical protein